MVLRSVTAILWHIMGYTVTFYQLPGISNVAVLVVPIVNISGMIIFGKVF